MEDFQSKVDSEFNGMKDEKVLKDEYAEEEKKSHEEQKEI
jgi:hypothetical protein